MAIHNSTKACRSVAVCLCLMFIVSKQVNLMEGKNFHFNTWEIEVEDEELMFESISPGLPCVPITFQCAGRIKEYENPQEEFGRLA